MLVLYSSREGQTRKVVAHVIEYLTVRGKEARIDDVENPLESPNAAGYRAVILAASVHLGEHAHRMIGFVRKHRSELADLPTAMLAVSLAAGAEGAGQDLSQHVRSGAEIAKATRDFLERTDFEPTRILPVAGAVLYTQEGRFVRFVMQRIGRDSGLDPCGHRDVEQTAWNRLDRFVDEFLSGRPPVPARRAAAVHG